MASQNSKIAQLNDQVAEIEDLKKQMASQNSKIAQLEDQLAPQKAKVDEFQDQVAE